MVLLHKSRDCRRSGIQPKGPIAAHNRAKTWKWKESRILVDVLPSSGTCMKIFMVKLNESSKD